MKDMFGNSRERIVKLLHNFVTQSIIVYLYLHNQFIATSNSIFKIKLLIFLVMHNIVLALLSSCYMVVIFEYNLTYRLQNFDNFPNIKNSILNWQAT